MTIPVTRNTIEPPQAPQGRENGAEAWKDFTEPALNRLKASLRPTAGSERLSSDVTGCSITDDCTYEPDELEELEELDETEEAEEAKELKEAKEAKETKEAKESKEAKQIGQAIDISHPAQRQEIDKLSPALLERIDAVICDYRVRSDGDFNRSLFMLAHQVRTIEEELNRRFSISATAKIAEQWQASNQNNLENDQDYLAEFLAKLDLVRFPKGSLARAVEIARRIPPPKQTLILCPKFQLLAKLCCVLQWQAGDEPFFLDGRSAATALDTPHSTAASWLRALCRLNVITPVKKGSRGTASRYRYIAEAESRPDFQPLR